MAANAVQVAIDQGWKLQLEKEFATEVGRLWTSASRLFTREVRARGWFSSPDERWGDILEQMLSRHYERTSGSFSRSLVGQLPSGVKATELELQLIDDTLANALSIRAGSQRLIINTNTAKQMDDALHAARRETQRLAAEGVARSVEEEAVEAGRALDRRLRGRTAGIASLETQAPAELSKQVSTEVLLGHTPTVAGGTYSEPSILKTWWSMGDDIVREDHLMADQQEQPLQEPYTVGPDLLMVPGDTSLGAPIGQVVNCRCSSVIDEDAVAEARAARGLGE